MTPQRNLIKTIVSDRHRECAERAAENARGRTSALRQRVRGAYDREKRNFEKRERERERSEIQKEQVTQEKGERERDTEREANTHARARQHTQ